MKNLTPRSHPGALRSHAGLRNRKFSRHRIIHVTNHEKDLAIGLPDKLTVAPVRPTFQSIPMNVQQSETRSAFHG